MENEQYKLDSSNFTWREVFQLILLKLSPSVKITKLKLIIAVSLLLLLNASLIVSGSESFYKDNTRYIIPSTIENASYFTQFEDSSTYLKALSVNEVLPTTWLDYIVLKVKYGKSLEYLKKEKGIEDDLKIITDVTHTGMVTNAYVAASKEAGLNAAYETKYRVMSTPNYEDSKEHLNVKPGDLILSVDGKPITSVQDIEYLTASDKSKKLHIIRLGEELNITSSLYSVYIQVTNEVKDKVALQEAVKLFDEKYTGTSAGAAIAVELYSHFVSDVVKGRKIAITGSIDADGKIGSIGGVVAKTILANDNGAEVMFVPFDSYIANNYSDANKINKQIGSEMKVVPVNTLHEVIKYLQVH